MINKPTALPVCCGKTADWIVQSPSLQYAFCRECKQEPGPKVDTALPQREHVFNPGAPGCTQCGLHVPCVGKMPTYPPPQPVPTKRSISSATCGDRVRATADNLYYPKGSTGKLLMFTPLYVQIMWDNGLKGTCSTADFLRNFELV